MAFHAFVHGHQDLVLAVDFNLYGNRMVTASSDHCLKVWDKKNDTWELIDTWKAHDAEVVDVKWNGPYTGNMLASVGDDGYFRVWEEDVLEAPNSHRRFKRVYQLPSPTRVPFMSLDFKNINTETYVGLTTRDGYLLVCEPTDSDDFREWHILTQMYVCATPPRQEETSFKVCFHHEKLPAWTACAAGLDRKSISLSVAAMDTVKVYRTDKERQFYLAAELTGSNSLVRDVAWSNGAMRGFDVIATASKDGYIRVYELTTPVSAKSESSGKPKSTGKVDKSGSHSTTDLRMPQSAIRAGLAGALRPSGEDVDAEIQASRVKHEVKLVSQMTHNRQGVWRVSFSKLGDLLVSSGDDGAVRTWKRTVDKGKGNATWIQYSVLEADVEISKTLSGA